MRTDTRAILAIASIALAAGLAPGATRAESERDEDEATLSVAVRESPPFAMRNAAGEWEGLSVALWEVIADDLGMRFEWRELDLPLTLEALEEDTVDVAIAGLTVTAARERRFDFSQPYLTSGLALAIAPKPSDGVLATLRAFLSLEFFTAVGALVVILMFAALGVWIFERRANPDQFGGSLARGLGESFWWSAVTMTTVGYGDRSPVTRGGRIVALVWMFTSVIVIASFTASIAASLAVNRLADDWLAERDIRDLRLAVISDTRAAAFAHDRGLQSRPFATLEEAAAALHAERADALLHDAPILQHFSRASSDDRIEVLDERLVRDHYAFAFPEDSPLHDSVNVALLSALLTSEWADIRNRHLGSLENPREP